MDREILKKKLTDESIKKYNFTEEICILQAIRERCGSDHILYICIEELSELQKEITKALRGESNMLGIKEEMADVAVCLEHLMFIFHIEGSDLSRVKDVKLQRMEEFLNDAT